MLTIPASTRISLCTTPIDMRKSFDGLLAIVRNVLEADPVSDHLFVFLNRQHTLMKILYWDGDGFAIWYKRLELGTFRFPACTDSTKSVEITRSGLSLILEGIDLSRLPKQKRFSKKSA
jgi:transposase